MDVRKTLQAGQHGTKRWLASSGNILLNLRYRYDDHQRLRYTTVEIIIDEKAYSHVDKNFYISPAYKSEKQSRRPFWLYSHQL